MTQFARKSLVVARSRSAKCAIYAAKQLLAANLADVAKLAAGERKGWVMSLEVAKAQRRRRAVMRGTAAFSGNRPRWIFNDRTEWRIKEALKPPAKAGHFDFVLDRGAAENANRKAGIIREQLTLRSTEPN